MRALCFKPEITLAEPTVKAWGARRPPMDGLRLNPSPNKKAPELLQRLIAGPTGLEPATFGLTGRCANHLHHDPNTLVTYKTLFKKAIAKSHKKVFPTIA